VTVALRDGRFEIDDARELSLDTRILLHVEQHPGCSQREIRETVTGKAQAIATAIRGLVSRGALEDRSNDDRMQLYAPTRGAS
jgi:predicted transcriptional regulator